MKKKMIVPKGHCSCTEEGTLFIEIGQVIKNWVANEKINLEKKNHENTFSCLTEIIIGL